MKNCSDKIQAAWSSFYPSNISKNLRDKHCQKIPDSAQQSATYALTTALKKTNQKAAEASADLIGSKITDRITKVSITLQQNNKEIV